MLVEKLSAEDRAAIQQYIHFYSVRENRPDSAMAPLEHILRFWDTAKSEYLYHLFGEKFILEKEIEFVQSEDEKSALMEEKLRAHENARNFRSELREYFNGYKRSSVDWCKSHDSDTLDNVYYGILRLTAYSTLAKNEYTGSTFSMPLPDGTTLNVPYGCKPVRMIGKIAKALEILHFDDFQIVHSQALNQKKVKGTLCLSIHPLDYMTMSDNTCGWSSCMSWHEQGQYRQGTVEMMNSPSVIVAYLKSDKETYRFGDYEWNSKKWRCLFIVDPRFICSVKPYPYYNEDLLSTTTDFLCSLDKQWEDAGRTFVERWYRDDTFIEVNHRAVILKPTTDMMYNDFGTTTHLLTVRNDVEDTHFGYFNYSGQYECMWCGIDSNIPCEDALVCDECEPAMRCCECGEVIYDPYYDKHGNAYCECCYDSIFDEDPLTEEIVYQDDLIDVDLQIKDVNAPTYLFRSRRMQQRDCYSDTTWESYFKIDNYRQDEEDCYYVYVEDCTEEGLKIFGIYDKDDLERYKSIIMQYSPEAELPF